MPPPGDARLAFEVMNSGAAWLKSGAANRAANFLEEALTIREAAYALQPQHPDRRDAAGWLILCPLNRGRAGKSAGLREKRARKLSDQYGFNLAGQKQIAL